MDMTTAATPDQLAAINAHREALGRPPLEAAMPWDLPLVEACAQYGADRWAPGTLEDAVRLLPDAEVEALLAMDEDALHDDLHEPSGSLAEVWREAGRRGMIDPA